MSRIQILTALLLAYLACTCAEEKEAQKRIDDYLKPPSSLILKAVPPPEDDSYLSKFTSWLGFGKSQKKTTIIHARIPPSSADIPYSGPALLPPTSHDSFSNGPPSYPPPSHSPPAHGPPPSGPQLNNYHSPPNYPPPSHNPPSHGPSPSGPQYSNYNRPTSHGPSTYPIPSHSPPSNGPPSSSSQHNNYHSSPHEQEFNPSRPRPDLQHRPTIKHGPAPAIVSSVQKPSLSQSSKINLISQESSNSNSYLLPHNGNGHGTSDDKDCNPCNKEPWVPIMGSYGKNSLIGFVPNSNSHHRPSGSYGPPQNIHPPVDSYAPPPSSQYGKPQFSSPSGSYGPPQQPPTYGPPNYKPPPPINTGPSGSYGPPAKPPPFLPTPSSNKYGPPPLRPNYGPPSRPRPHLPPPPSSHIGPPPGKYGAPNKIPPSSNYGPPPKQTYSPPTKLTGPSNNYGPPTFGFVPTHSSSSSLPQSSYGAPPSSNFGPALSPPSNNYGPPLSGPLQNNSPQPSSPPLSYKPPTLPSSFSLSGSYSAPHSSAPVSNYGSSPSSPSDNQGPPPSNNHLPPSQNYGPPQTFSPSSSASNNFNAPSGKAKFLSTNFSPPAPNTAPINYQVLPSASAAQNFKAPAQAPVNLFVTPLSTSQGATQDSYGPPAAGPIHSSPSSAGADLKVTSAEYLPPRQELPISNENDDLNSIHLPPNSQQASNYNSVFLNPVPFPNMSPNFIAPIRNYRPFRPTGNGNFQTHGSNAHTSPSGSSNQNQNGVQVSQSIPVAEFLSTIEYPPNLIQSPIIDLVVNNEQNEDFNKNEAFNKQQQQNYATQQQQHHSTQQQNHQIPSQNHQNNHHLNFNDNPIVVDSEEHHQEASDNHASVALNNNTNINFHTDNHNFLDLLTDSKPTGSAIQDSINNNTLETHENVQTAPSLQTLFNQDSELASIIAKQLLNENNNPPKPFETNPHGTILQISQNAEATNNALFTPPSSLDYSNWNPTVGSLSTAMNPPPPSQTSWISAQNYVPFTTNKKPKPIQIIVPYTTNNNKDWYEKPSLQGRKVPPGLPTNPPIALFGKLPTAQESQWLKYSDHNSQATQTNIQQTVSPLTNIQDFFKDTTVNVDSSHQKLPFDILKLQQNIDVWTEQEFNKMNANFEKLTTTTRYAYSKKIPDEYLTTQSTLEHEFTTPGPNANRYSKHVHDYIGSGSINHPIETKVQLNRTDLGSIGNSLLETNLIKTEKTTQKPVASTTPETWDKIQVSISPLTNERVYVVTPQQWETDATTPSSAWSYKSKKEIQQINKQMADNAKFAFNSPRFSVRPEPAQLNKTKELDINSQIHSVYSDWPEKINNLATTSLKSLPSPHPLLGRMDISEHTPPPEGTVQTYTGHSKVVTAVTASSESKKKTEDKKFTTGVTPTPTTKFKE